MEPSIINSILLGIVFSFIWKSRSRPIGVLKLEIVPFELREEFRGMIYLVVLVNIGLVAILIIPLEYLGFTAEQLLWLRLITRLTAIAYLVWATRLVAKFIVRYSLEHAQSKYVRART